MSCFDRTKMNCIVYTMSCNFATHGTCPLALMTYKHIELQMFSTIQKLNCKANCNTPFFFHSDCTKLFVCFWLTCPHTIIGPWLWRTWSCFDHQSIPAMHYFKVNCNIALQCTKIHSQLT